MTNEQCISGSDWDSTDITPSMMCAADTGKAACFGDSGGPLVIKEGIAYFVIGEWKDTKLRRKQRKCVS